MESKTWWPYIFGFRQALWYWTEPKSLCTISVQHLPNQEENYYWIITVLIVFVLSAMWFHRLLKKHNNYLVSHCWVFNRIECRWPKLIILSYCKSWLRIWFSVLSWASKKLWFLSSFYQLFGILIINQMLGYIISLVKTEELLLLCQHSTL